MHSNLVEFKRKLNSESGVSILFAMMAFLFATTISTVIVSAALTATKSSVTNKVDIQERLALMSAAQLVRDEIAEIAVVDDKESSSKNSEEEANESHEGEPKSDIKYDGFQTDMKQKLEDAIINKGVSSGSFSIETDDIEFDEINVKWEMLLKQEPEQDSESDSEPESDFTLKFTFTSTNESKLYLTMKPSIITYSSYYVDDSNIIPKSNTVELDRETDMKTVCIFTWGDKSDNNSSIISSVEN